jgi:prepilin-type N-terminal cleavage/methylation domain-containing protein
MMPYNRSAYTIVEIMIVVAILAVLTSVALPNYIKSGKTSARNVCVSNLKQIDSAIEQWAIDNNIPAGSYPSASQEDAIYGYIDSGIPKCPSGGEYTIYKVNMPAQVRCSREEDEDHKLPQ